MDKIEQFIQKRFTKDCNWLNGNCYYFSIILQDRFPNGKIIYEPIDGHFLYKVKNKCYDFLGMHELPSDYYIWDELEAQEPNLYKRIKKDCIK